MLFFTLGIIAFLLFYLYDFNTIYFKSEFGKKSFLAGGVLLLISTAGLICNAVRGFHIDPEAVLAMILALLFLALEIYTLFGALPVEKAYSGELSEDNRVYKKGMYALCRHPGVLWFAGFYLFLAIAFRNAQLYKAAFLFTFLDFIYIVLQDIWIFPKQFSDYDAYKASTPFLIPNIKSIKSAFTH